jgi:hypothetical protein
MKTFKRPLRSGSVDAFSGPRHTLQHCFALLTSSSAAASLARRRRLLLRTHARSARSCCSADKRCAHKAQGGKLLSTRRVAPMPAAAGSAASQVADAEETTVVATLFTALAVLVSVLLGRHVTQKCAQRVTSSLARRTC